METYLPKRVHRYAASVFDVHVLRSRFRFGTGDLTYLGARMPRETHISIPQIVHKEHDHIGTFCLLKRDDEMKRERSKSRFLIF